MSKISGLPPLPDDAVSGDEIVPVVKNGMTRRAALGALAAPAILQAETARDVALAASGPIYQSVPEGEAATPVGQTFFIAVGGALSAYRRIDGGSLEIFSQATTAALASPLGIGMVGVADGRNGQQALDAKVEYPRTALETAQSITPTDYLEPELDPQRYDITSTPVTALNNVFKLMNNSRTYPGYVGTPTVFNSRGLGTVNLPRQRVQLGESTWSMLGASGLIVEGQGIYASGLEANRMAGPMVDITTYLGVTFKNMAIVNTAATLGSTPGGAGTSVGIALHPNNGGQAFGTEKIHWQGLDSCVTVDQTVNGDTGLYLHNIVDHTNNRFFDIVSANTQAIIHCFMANAVSCAQSFIRTAGAAEVAVYCHNQPLYEAFLEFTDGAGSNACRFGVRDSKFEYWKPGYAHYLIDDSDGVTAAGRGVEVMFDHCSLEGGQDQPANRDTHTVMTLGRKVWDIKIFNSNIAGTITLDSTGIASIYSGKRWWIHNNQFAPKNLTLTGSYGPLVEYRANGNVPDHYRWGQGGNYTLDAEKVFAYRSSTTTLINTGITADQSTGGGFGARYGYQRTIQTGLPNGTPLLAIGALIKSYGGSASDTRIELCSDATFATVLETVTIPAGYAGLYKHELDPTSYPSLTNGELHVRVSVPTLNVTRVGALLAWYFPWAIS